MRPISIRSIATTLTAGLLAVAALPALAADGLIAAKSPFDVAETMNRFEKIATDKGMTIFARVNHAAGAKKVNADLRPTELLIFGNPAGGTPLMQCSQSFGIDLPLKALVWQDEQGQTWIGVNDMATLAERHGAENCPAVPKVGQAVRNFMDAAIKP